MLTTQKNKSQRLRGAGHVLRLPDNRLTKLIWEEDPSERRRLGRPRMRRRVNIWADLTAIESPTYPTLMEDVVRWKQTL